MRRRSVAAGVMVLAVLGLWLWSPPGGPDQPRDAPQGQSSLSVSTHGADPDSGLSYVDALDLPAQARETLRLIGAGGPFRYPNDGSTFENREGILPREAGGYYREYTVATPGSDDRGARRVVSGQQGELYCSGDHYQSFARIRQ